VTRRVQRRGHGARPLGNSIRSLLADQTGSITERSVYDAVGTLRHAQTQPQTGYLYTGQQFEAATGLYSLRARYDQPGVGRFLSRDTWPVDLENPIEYHRYGYVANNPVNGFDPSGFALVDFTKVQSQVVARISTVAATGTALADNFARVLARVIQYPFSRQTVQQATRLVDFGLLQQATRNGVPRLSIIEGVYRTTSGQTQRIIAVNNFYGDKRIYNAHLPAINYLRNLVGVNNFKGGEYGSVAHAEQNFVGIARTLQDIEKVNGVARVMGGSSNAICPTCQRLGHWNSVRGVLEVAYSDLKIFIGGIIK
jgi:RHS repeat-associated protein